MRLAFVVNRFKARTGVRYDTQQKGSPRTEPAQRLNKRVYVPIRRRIGDDAINFALKAMEKAHTPLEKRNALTLTRALSLVIPKKFLTRKFCAQ